MNHSRKLHLLVVLADLLYITCRPLNDGQMYMGFAETNDVYVGLARTIYIRCIYDTFGRKFFKYTVIYGVCVQFWPTLRICDECGGMSL
jgi:hypothetical protein